MRRTGDAAVSPFGRAANIEKLQAISRSLQFVNGHLRKLAQRITGILPGPHLVRVFVVQLEQTFQQVKGAEGNRAQQVTDARLRGSQLELSLSSGGSRTCIGMRFGQLEVKAIASSILSRFRLELANPGRGVSIRQMPTLSPRGGMPMIVREH